MARGLNDSYSLSNKQIKNVSSHQSPCRKKIELLESFEEKINNLEEELDYFSQKDIFYCHATQTEYVPSLKFEECDFEGGRDREIEWHVGRHHGDDKAEVMDMSNDDEGDSYCKE